MQSRAVALGLARSTISAFHHIKSGAAPGAANSAQSALCILKELGTFPALCCSNRSLGGSTASEFLA